LHTRTADSAAKEKQNQWVEGSIHSALTSFQALGGLDRFSVHVYFVSQLLTLTRCAWNPVDVLKLVLPYCCYRCGAPAASYRKDRFFGSPVHFRSGPVASIAQNEVIRQTSICSGVVGLPGHRSDSSSGRPCRPGIEDGNITRSIGCWNYDSRPRPIRFDRHVEVHGIPRARGRLPMYGCPVLRLFPSPPVQFLGPAEKGWIAANFLAKAKRAGHVREIECAPSRLLYQPCAKQIYRIVGKKNSQSRRPKSPREIRRRLIMLDYVLALAPGNSSADESLRRNV
jgi:hypothetical protein